MKIRRLAALPLLLVPLAACDSPVASDLDPAIRSLLSGPLAVGEVEAFAGEFARTIAVDGGTEGAEYLYVVSNVSTAGGSSVQITVRGDGISSGTTPSAEPGAEGPRLHLGPEAHAHEAALHPLDDGGFHLWHRERENRLVEAMVGGLPGGGRSLLRQSATVAAVPARGDIVQLNVNAMQACENPQWRDGKVMAVGDQAVVIADLRNPDVLPPEFFERIADDFDRKVYPLSSANFGEPAREIGPPRTTIFYTTAVNELASGFGGLIGGFFFSRDLFPRTTRDGFQGCPGSNEREMFYMLTADPDGRHGQRIPVDYVEDRSLTTVMHEHQHLVNASRRLYIIGTGNLEEVWLNEALSHVAEELLFYQESGLSPRQNLGLQEVTASQQRLNAVNRYQVQNLVRYLLYLADPPAHTPIDPQDGLEVRGASWSFLRYLADHYAADDATFFFELVNTSQRGIANLRNRLGMELEELRVPMRRWDVSNYADDLVRNLDPLYRQPSWNFRTLLPALTEDDSFPLTAERLGPQGQVAAGIRGGSAAFIRFGVPPGQRATLTTEAGGEPPPETVRGTLIRIR